MAAWRVEATYPAGDDWREVDAAIVQAAGRPGDFHGVGVCPRGRGLRKHSWHVGDGAAAEDLRKALEDIPGVEAVMWEFV